MLFCITDKGFYEKYSKNIYPLYSGRAIVYNEIYRREEMDGMTEIEQRIRAAQNPVALTGAGISAPSGIPTFQGAWKGRPIRSFLSREYFETHRIEFFELYIEMVSWCQKQPNPAHLALAEWGLPVITQNIDGLHHKAGSRKIYELHGSLRTLSCPKCGKVIEARPFAEDLKAAYAVRDYRAVGEKLRCSCSGLWETDVVLYGDAVRHMEEAYELSARADLMLVVGSSLTTYPAAALPDVARRHGAEVILVNDDCVGHLTGQGD